MRKKKVDEDQGQKNSAEETKVAEAEDEEFAEFIAYSETEEWRESARIGMTVAECFQQTLGKLESDNVCSAIRASIEDLIRQALANPCCEDRSFMHTLSMIASSCAIWGFQAGARSGNIVGIEGLDHTPVPFPPDEKIEKSRLDYIEHRRSEVLAAKARVDEVVEELGLQRMEHGGVSGIVVKNARQLQDLLNRLSSGGVEVQESEDDAPRGMYL